LRSLAAGVCQVIQMRGSVGLSQSTCACRLCRCFGSTGMRAASTLPFQLPYAFPICASVASLSKSPAMKMVALSGV